MQRLSPRSGHHHAPFCPSQKTSENSDAAGNKDNDRQCSRQAFSSREFDFKFCSIDLSDQQQKIWHRVTHFQQKQPKPVRYRLISITSTPFNTHRPILNTVGSQFLCSVINVLESQNWPPPIVDPETDFRKLYSEYHRIDVTTAIPSLVHQQPAPNGLLSYTAYQDIFTVPTVLDRIITYKKQEITERKTVVTEAELQRQAEQAPVPQGFHNALRQASTLGLIAEVKKASPSAGIIRQDFDPVTIAKTYEAAGAHCLSVLTDEPSFQGHLDFLKAIKPEVSIPVMRKEFIIDSYQILEARAAGADCVLLIAECLNDQQLNELHQFAHQLGMDTLIELYEPTNLPRVLATGAKLIGVNNRDLRTFETSLEHTFELKAQIPDDVSLISESGIQHHADIQRLTAAGIAGVLVGESLMRQTDIDQAVRSLMTGS